MIPASRDQRCGAYRRTNGEPLPEADDREWKLTCVFFVNRTKYTAIPRESLRAADARMPYRDPEFCQENTLTDAMEAVFCLVSGI